MVNSTKWRDCKFHFFCILTGANKDMSDAMISEEKRAPNPGFFGMRGKKAPLVTLTLNFHLKISITKKKILLTVNRLFRHQRQKRSIRISR